MQKRQIFVTTALPYANGHFHIGHIMEYIQADIWVRTQRMYGHTVHFVGADDTHGAPMMIAAQKEGITPQEFVARIAAGRKAYLDGFHIKFDHWYSTDSEENVMLSQDIYKRLKAAGLIYTKDIEQFYDPVKGMFLADRFIKGTCPRCGADDQYGDNCEKCGAVYSPTELINPFSALSGAKPELRKSTHYFFKLSDPACVTFLRDWVNGKGKSGADRVQAEIRAKDEEWLGEGKLGDWDISRDEPYFGIPIPDAPGKYFYVWLDAPVGYYASLMNYAKKIGFDFWKFLDDEKTEQIHFIGKDIVYFHTLFWPAMLHFAGQPYRVPDNVFVHGFMTVDGRKMSKSLGNTVQLMDATKTFGAEILRLWVASTDYSGELSFGKTIVKHVTDSYRRIRNTLRFLLANTSDFDITKDAVKFEDMIELDRWAIARVAQLQKEVIELYNDNDFHPIVAKLQSFASDDLGSFYLDILKDRLYTTATTGLARRSAQTALWYITAAYLRLMAPILSFTAEEAFAIFEPGKSVSIFTEEFFNLPEIAGAEELLAKWERIRKVRTDVQKEIENLRTEGKVGSSLQAEVDITVDGDDYEALASLGDELRFVMITSRADLHQGPASVSVHQSAAPKCARCWHYTATVGTVADHPTLCARCAENLFGAGETRRFA